MAGVSGNIGEQMSGVHVIRRWSKYSVVFAIGILAVAGGTWGVRAYTNASEIAETHTAVFDIRSAAIAWQIDHGDSACPNVKQLIGGKYLTSFTRLVDSWDRPFAITCYQLTIAVASSGPDRTKGTSDDIVAPAAQVRR